ncbi:thioesterase II family protein [Kocuria sp. U4B]
MTATPDRSPATVHRPARPRGAGDRVLVDLGRRPGAPPAGGAPARWRLVCLPPAGSGAGFFRFLHRPGVELLAVRYPGRESRLREEPARSVEEVLAEALPAVEAVLAADELPTAVLGHSMGAVVAAELTAALERRLPGRTGLLCLSARSAPGARDDAEIREVLRSDEALTAWLRDLGGTPPVVLEDPGFLSMQLRILRADLALTLGHEHLPGPVATPLLLLAAAGDEAAPAASMEGWRGLSTGPVLTRALPGGHHALLGHGPELLELLERTLFGVVPGDRG